MATDEELMTEGGRDSGQRGAHFAFLISHFTFYIALVLATASVALLAAWAWTAGGGGRALAHSVGAGDEALERATAALRQGKTAEGIALLESARLMRPDSPLVLTQLAAAYYGQRRYEEARQVALELNERAPDNVDALYILGACAETEGAVWKARFYYSQVRDLLSSGAKTALPISAAEIAGRIE